MLLLELLFVLLISYGATYFLVPINIRFSQKYKLIDFPHNRGIHTKEIPLAGGLSIGLPIIILQVLFDYINPNFEFQFIKIAVGSTLFLLLGYLDDKRKFTAKYKLLFQIGIACLMYYLGFKIEILTNPFGDDIILGIISFPLTIVWFLLVINAFNLIDGIDGLASGIAVIVNLVLFAVGLLFSNKMIMLLALTLIGSNMAFLKYNFYPAKIFMGDTGSLFIGFNIAAISVTGSIQFKGITTMTLLIPIIALTFPISDTFLAIVSRIKKKESIFLADKEHIHHKMMESGYNQKTISIIGYTITFLFGLIAFGFSFASKEILLVILLLLIILLALFFIFTKGLHK